MEKIYQKIAKTLNIGMDQVVNTMNLLNEGNTVPFIARYRKEMTKGLVEEEILFISQEFVYQQNLAKRKEDVIRLIEVQGKITPEIIASVNACAKLSLIEDIYRPYQQKRKTRATDAVAKGLKPLADFIMELKQTGDVNVEALNAFEDGTVVTVQMLLATRLVRKELDGIKILGVGELTKKLTVQVNAFSKTAQEAIEKVGGKAEVI